MRIRVSSLLAIGAILMGIAPLPAFSAHAAGAVPRFDAVPCMYTLPDGANATCGYLTVPEFHAVSNGRTLRLAVVRFASTAAVPQHDPLIYLEGGPGGGIAGGILQLFKAGIPPAWLAQREVILFDQRGVGKSEPALDCPENLERVLRDAATVLSPRESAAHDLAATLACRDRLRAQGINFDAYNSAEGAADVNDLRAALGYDTVNLFGTSYGTRVALTVMRDFPQIVRSAVLDGPVPLEVNKLEEENRNFDVVLRQFFATCAASASCQKSYPTLAGDFSAVVQQLNTQPLPTKITNTADGKTYDVLVTGDDVASLISETLYVSNAGVIIPQMLAQLKARNTVLLDIIIAAFVIPGADDSTGAYHSVICAEEAPFNDIARAQVTTADLLPEFREIAASELDTRFEVCKQWGVSPRGEIETRAVTATTPTLILTSDNDPATPARYGTIIAADLPNSTLVAFPGVGHTTIAGGGVCIVSVIAAYINDPTTPPPTACVRAARMT